MGFDRAVAGGVGHAGEHEAGFDLVVVEEALIRLIHGAGGELASAGGAGAGAAGVGEVDALLFGSVEDVLVVRNLDRLVEAFALIDEGDLVRGHGEGFQGPARGRVCLAWPDGLGLAKSPFGVIAPRWGALLSVLAFDSER